MIRIIVSLLALLAGAAFAQPADTILVNGKVPVGEIGGIESLFILLGGRIVYAAGPYEKLGK
jgi:hypothetical protein